MRALLLATALLLVPAVLPSATATGSPRDPPGSEGATDLVVGSHDRTMAATLHFYDWCPEDSEYCQSGVIDYAYSEHRPRLPYHPGSTLSFKTGRKARALTISFRRRGPDQHLPAVPSGEDGRSWTLTAPFSPYPRQTIGIVADYRYWRAGHRYGGRYHFSLDVKQHRHRR